MTVPTRPAPSSRTCPVCGGAVAEAVTNSGWVQRAADGTRLGTFPSEPPVDFGPGWSVEAARLEHYPAMDQTIVEPCGHHLTREQSDTLRAT